MKSEGKNTEKSDNSTEVIRLYENALSCDNQGHLDEAIKLYADALQMIEDAKITDRRIPQTSHCFQVGQCLRTSARI